MSGEKTEELVICLACGSKNISGIKHQKAWLNRFGAVMGIYTCQDCGYEGLPLILDSEKDRKRYKKELKTKE